MSLFQKIFKPRNGTTFVRAQSLYSGQLPTYLELGTRYRVIERTRQGIHLTGDPSYIYMIQSAGRHGPVLFVESPFELPDVFWIRGLITWRTEYEILPEDNEGIPLQIQLARQSESSLSVA